RGQVVVYFLGFFHQNIKLVNTLACLFFQFSLCCFKFSNGSFIVAVICKNVFICHSPLPLPIRLFYPVSAAFHVPMLLARQRPSFCAYYRHIVSPGTLNQVPFWSIRPGSCSHALFCIVLLQIPVPFQ